MSSQQQHTARLFTLKHLLYVFFVLGVWAAAYAISSFGFLDVWAGNGGWWWILLALVGGFFFTSIATVPLSFVMISSLAQAGMPIYAIALLGGFGAALGDAGLSAVIRVSIVDDLFHYLVRKTHGLFGRVMGDKLVRIAAIVLGMIVIASPLPDEIALALLGIAHVPGRYVPFLVFIPNALGIALIAYIAT